MQMPRYSPRSLPYQTPWLPHTKVAWYGFHLMPLSFPTQHFLSLYFTFQVLFIPVFLCCHSCPVIRFLLFPPFFSKAEKGREQKKAMIFFLPRTLVLGLMMETIPQNASWCIPPATTGTSFTFFILNLISC